jgi:hypothetical protein
VWEQLVNDGSSKLRCGCREGVFVVCLVMGGLWVGVVAGGDVRLTCVDETVDASKQLIRDFRLLQLRCKKK